MATKIAPIPVLTGEVAREFEEQAQKTYQEYLKRSAANKRRNTKSPEQLRYEQGIQMVRDILAKSNL